VQLTDAHVRLIVADFDGCFRFYRDILGLRVTWGEEADGTARGYASFALRDTALALNDQRVIGPPLGLTLRDPRERAPDHVALILGVDDVDAELTRLRSHGVEIVNDATSYAGWGIRAAHVRDPDGNLIELNQPLAREEWLPELRAEEERFRGTDGA
jgi:catechol 2,3-dioxygenase-like lactoylglutathione lyase family enzyme